MFLKIAAEDQGKNKVLRLDGRLDAVSSPALEKKIFEFVEGGHIRILLDFSQVDYLSSAGLRLMLSATKKVRAKGGLLVFCSLQDEVMEIVKMAGFERMLPIYPNEQQALAALE